MNEQLAHCLYLAGQMEESLGLFEAALARYEVQPQSLEVTRYIEAASTFFPDQLGPRVGELLRGQELDSVITGIEPEQ